MTLPHTEKIKPYSWAENAGGGDFLMWQDSAGRYRPMIGTRTDYRAHGPCLTDVSYREESGGGEIATRMDVSIPAANDHLRTCVRLRYDVKKPMRWSRLAFFQLGADFYNEVPARKVAIGDVAGLTEEWEPKRAKDEYDRAAVPLPGDGAWGLGPRRRAECVKQRQGRRDSWADRALVASCARRESGGTARLFLLHRVGQE